MDDKYYRYLLKKAKKRKLRITTYSKKKINADIILLNKKKIYKTHIINLKIKGEKKSFLIPNDLSNYTENIIATISILINYFDIEKINKNIFLGFNIPKGRGSIINIYKGSKKITIIDESYNSNPLSLKFALERFDAGYKQNNRKFLLIGNMLELGRHTKKLHMEIARYINKSKVNKTYVYGKFTKHTFNKLKPQIRGRILNNNMDILNLINKDLPNNSFLMVKGSNSTGLNKIIQNL